MFGPSSGAEGLNAKHIWNEDHDAILEEIGTGEKVLIMMRKHHLVMHGSSSSEEEEEEEEEEDGSDQE
jgi:hypothetical protein